MGCYEFSDVPLVSRLIMAIVLTLSIAVALLAFCVGEWLPLDIVALATAALLMLFGLVTPEEGISGFGNSATITVMAMFILSAGISRTGAVQMLNHLLLKWGGNKTSQQMFALGMIVGPITAFINNTAVVATFIPIVENWCKQRKISPSKLLLPLSYMTILGGMITVIGTSTNVLASGISKKLGYGEFQLFQFTALGLITFGVGLAFMVFLGPKLLPNRVRPDRDLVQDSYGLKHYLSEIEITPGSSLIGQALGSSGLRHSSRHPNHHFGVEVLELIRNGLHFSHPLDQQMLVVGDVLSVKVSQTDLMEIKAEGGIEIHPERRFAGISDEDGLAEVLVLANSNLIGSTLKELRFRDRYNATVLAIRHHEAVVRDRLSNIPLKFGDVLLLQGPQPSLSGLGSDSNLLVIGQPEIAVMPGKKAWIAVGIMLGVVILAALNLMSILLSSIIGVILMVVTGCIKPSEIYGAVHWDVIFLLAGLIPLGTAMEKSGATTLLANALTGIGGHLSGYWLLTIFFVVTSILTEVLSNNASVVLLLPVAAQVAEKVGLNPMAFIFAITFAASNSFMTPIGYQTNTMVYGPGGYKFMDYIRIGLPLNILMAVITPPLIILIYGL
jgi:di/tricarboxylate transporter